MMYALAYACMAFICCCCPVAVAFIVGTGGGDGAKTTPPSPVASTLAPAGAYPYVAILAIGTSTVAIGACGIAPYAFAAFPDTAAAAAAAAACALEYIPIISVYDATFAAGTAFVVSVFPRLRPLPDASPSAPSSARLLPRLGIALDSIQFNGWLVGWLNLRLRGGVVFLPAKNSVSQSIISQSVSALVFLKISKK